MTVDVSVVLPAYRNATTLPLLAVALDQALSDSGYSFEIVVVDDGSPDGTADVATRLRADDERLRLVCLDRNVGQQRAIFEGLRVVRGRAVAVMDADLQDPPEALPRLLRVLEDEGLDAVFAGRRGRYESMLRLLTSRLFKRLLSVLTGLPRDAGGYVVMTFDLTRRLLAMPGSDPYLLGMIGCVGATTRSIPVTRNPRPDGTSSYTARMRVGMSGRALFHILRTWRPK